MTRWSNPNIVSKNGKRNNFTMDFQGKQFLLAVIRNTVNTYYVPSTHSRIGGMGYKVVAVRKVLNFVKRQYFLPTAPHSYPSLLHLSPCTCHSVIVAFPALKYLLSSSITFFSYSSLFCSNCTSFIFLLFIFICLFTIPCLHWFLSSSVMTQYVCVEYVKYFIYAG